MGVYKKYFLQDWALIGHLRYVTFYVTSKDIFTERFMRPNWCIVDVDYQDELKVHKSDKCFSRNHAFVALKQS